MPAFLIADIKVNDQSWVPGYAGSVHTFVHKHGGRFLSRSGNVKVLEGEPLDTTLIAIIEFPSMQAAEDFLNDPDYAPLRQSRRSGSDSRLHLIDDTDIAGTIDYLPRGLEVAP